MKEYFKCILDATIQGFVFFLLTQYVISIYYGNSVLNALVFILSIAISLISFYFSLSNICEKIFIKYTINVISFLLIICVVLINSFFGLVEVFPKRELVNTDGFIIILSQSAFISMFILSRVLILIKIIIHKRITKSNGYSVSNKTNS